MRPFNKREGKKNLHGPRMGQTLGFSWWAIWLHAAPVKKKRGARDPQNRRAEDVIIWINLG